MRCSEMIGVESPTAALDFDLTCALRLLQFDNDREHARLKLFKDAMKVAIAEVFLGLKPDENDDSDGDISDDDLL